MKKIAIVMGSDSDLPVAEKAAQTLKEAQHMGLGSAHVAAGNEMDDFHAIAPFAF